MPVSLTFDLHHKHQDLVTAHEALKNKQISLHYQEAELPNLTQPNEENEDIANIELDDEGLGIELGHDVCKMKFEHENSEITIQARVIKLTEEQGAQRKVFFNFRHALEACKCFEKWESPFKIDESTFVEEAPNEHDDEID